ncbi:MAG: DUF1858 domain-containing protein [Clostridia bacterium]
MDITKEMLIIDLLQSDNAEALAEVLQGFGMHCLGCSLARMETVEQAAAAHGVDAETMVAALKAAEQSN